MHITLSGQTPAQKNRKKITTFGGVPRLYTEKSVATWQKQAAKELAMLYQRDTFTDRVSVSYKFYVKDNRRRDIDNMIASCNDALVLAGIVVDDSWQAMKIGGADAEIDKLNPRAELVITPIG